MTDFYSDASSVLRRTGIHAEDLGIEDSDPDEALADFVESVLTEITDLMDRTMRMSYLGDDAIPPGLNGIAADAASNSLREMVVTRQTPVVRIDDFAVRVIESIVLSADIQRRLKLYSKGRGVVSVGMAGDLAPLPPVFTPANLL